MVLGSNVLDKIAHGVWRQLIVFVLTLVCAAPAIVGAVRATPSTLSSSTQSGLPDDLAGTIHLSLQADRQVIGIADRLQVTLSAEAPAAVNVTLPAVASSLGPFTVLRQSPVASSRIAPGRQVWRRVYELEAERSGDLIIPSLTVRVTRRDAGDASSLALQTDPLTITVTTVLGDDADVKAPKDIAPPVALRRRGVPSWVWGGLGTFIALSALLGLWWWRRRRKARAMTEAPRQLAHLLALQALEDLMQAGLMQEAQAERFYVRLSDIVRQYVEWRFGLQATEQTTEEFLAAVHQTGGLIGSHQALLGTFLAHCDLVKFARYQPGLADMQRAYDSAREFVQHTADAEAWVEARLSGVGV